MRLSWWMIPAAFVLIYILRIVSFLNHIPKAVLQQSPTRWTSDEIRAAYERAQEHPIDVRKFLPPPSGRRYVVVGASGLVGGWIVQHLLMRGERPSAIRMLDIRRLSKSRNEGVPFMHVDITDAQSLQEAFAAPWAPDVANAPLTVFHTAAIIDCESRASDLFARLAHVNVEGTKNVLVASRTAGATVFISTSSASIAVKAVRWFPWPWKYYPDNFIQTLPNADPEKSAAQTRPDEYYGNYARSKHLAEELVRDADERTAGFRTGCIRPGNAIYGTGVTDSSSMTWRFLSSGGHPSWAHDCMQNFVDAQNVSVAHLLLESQLVHPTNGHDFGGSAYCITDPNPPITYSDLYHMLMTLSTSPMRFPRVPVLPILVLTYLIEAFVTLQRRHPLGRRFLPRLTGHLLLCQPAVFTVSRANLHFDIAKARRELGYRGPFTTIDGVATSLVEWNASLREQKKGEEKRIFVPDSCADGGKEKKKKRRGQGLIILLPSRTPS